MNIGIFTDTYSPTISGCVISVKMLESELRARGHTVYIFTVANPKAERLPDVFRLPSMPLSFVPTQRIAFLYPPKILFKFKRLNLDVIHTHTEFPLGILGKLVSGFYRIPMVHTYHTMYEDYIHYIMNGHLVTPKAAERYSRIFCNGANTVITPTAKTRECLLRYKVKRPIEVIPTGFNLGRFGPDKYSPEEIAELKDKFGIPRGVPVVVTVTRIAKEKSIDAVIKEIPKLLIEIPSAKYVIVGDGPSKAELEKLTADLNLQNSVIFTGAVPYDEVGKYYRLGDCFVCASTTETQGLTYAEAMASGLPVAVKNDECVKDLVKDGETGFLFENNSDCAAVLKKILVDRENAAAVARRGYESVRHLSAENYALRVEEIYKKCIENRPKKTVYITLQEMLKKAATHVIDTGEKNGRY